MGAVGDRLASLPTGLVEAAALLVQADMAILEAGHTVGLAIGLGGAVGNLKAVIHLGDIGHDVISTQRLLL